MCNIFSQCSNRFYEALALHILAWTISNMLNGKAHKSGENPDPSPCPAGGSRMPTPSVKIDISTCQSNRPMESRTAPDDVNPSGEGGLLLVPTHHNLQLDKISVRSISSEDISNGGSGRCCNAAARNPAIKTGRRLQLMQVSLSAGPGRHYRCLGNNLSGAA